MKIEISNQVTISNASDWYEQELEDLTCRRCGELAEVRIFNGPGQVFCPRCFLEVGREDGTGDGRDEG